MIKMQKRRPLLPIIIAIAISLVAIAAVLLLLNKPQSEVTEETQNYTIVKVSSDDDGAEKGSVDASLKYAGYVTLKNDAKIITMNFENPSKAKKSLSLEIVANVNGEDVTLTKVDKIDPGYKVVDANSIANEDIPVGKYDGKFIIYFYDENGQEEMVNSEVQIEVRVE